MSEQSAPWVVLKFGGTSVSSLERWQVIADVARQRVEEGLRPLLVCSAIGGVSDLLETLLEAAPRGEHAPLVEELRQRHLTLAEALGLDAEALIGEELSSLERTAHGIALLGEVSPRVQARCMSLGELMLTRLASVWLGRQGLACELVDARDCLRSVDEPHASASRAYLSGACTGDPDPALQQRLAALAAPLLMTQGFIARDGAGDTVLLGRGGSDTSAAYLAAALQAERCEIWTDVPGMFSANPRMIPAARLLKHLHYDEAQEIASTGARVLHPRCVQPLRRAAIPLHVRCTSRPDVEGTVVGVDAGGGAGVKAVSLRRNITLVSMDTVGMWQQVGFLAQVFEVFKAHGISVDTVSTSESNVTVTLDPSANALAQSVLDALLADLGQVCQARVIGPCAAVCLVGRKIRALLHKLGPTLEVFEEQQVHLVSQAASDLNFTFVVDEDQAERLVRQLHAQLVMHWLSDTDLGPAWEDLELDGPAEKPRTDLPWWQRRRDELLALASEQTPVFVYDLEQVKHAASQLRGIDAVERIFYATKANPHPELLRCLERAGLNFECVSPGELDHVRSTLPGLAPERLLFTPNFAPADEYRRAYACGATVTLDNLFPLQHWPEIFAGREIVVRVDPGRGRGHHAHVRTAGPQSKFGVAPEEIAALKQLVAEHGVDVVGLHSHVGSGVLRAETWREVALFLARLADEFPKVRLLNLGGGLGVPERPGQPHLDVSRLAAILAEVHRAHPQFELWLEPGRFLVAEAGVLLTRVTQTKQKGEVRYVGVDVGMNSLIRPALYGAYHDIVNLSRVDQAASLRANVVGPICETGDTLGYNRRLAPVETGDVMLVATCGAYGRAMSSSYNLRAPAVEYVL